MAIGGFKIEIYIGKKQALIIALTLHLLSEHGNNGC